MAVAVPYLAYLLALLGYLDLGIFRTGIIGVLALAVWIGLLENLRRRPDPRVSRGRLILLWSAGAFYATFMFLALYVNSDTFKDDLLIYLPGQLLFLYFVTTSKVREDRIILGMVVLGLSQAAFAFLQYGATPVFDALFSARLGEASASNYHFSIGRLSGIWLDAVRLGVVLAVCYPFVLLWARQKKSTLRYVVLGVVVTATILTFTRVALLSLVVSSVVMLWESRRVSFARGMPALLALAVLVIVLQALPIGQQLERLYSPSSYQSEYQTDSEQYNRGRVLEALLPLVAQRPLFGIGLSYRDYLSAGFTSAHNSVLQSALLFGVPATALVLVFVWMLSDAVRLVLSKANASFALAALMAAMAVVIGGTTHGVLFDSPLNMLFWMMAGLGLRQTAEVLGATEAKVTE